MSQTVAEVIVETLQAAGGRAGDVWDLVTENL